MPGSVGTHGQPSDLVGLILGRVLVDKDGSGLVGCFAKVDTGDVRVEEDWDLQVGRGERGLGVLSTTEEPVGSRSGLVGVNVGPLGGQSHTLTRENTKGVGNLKTHQSPMSIVGTPTFRKANINSTYHNTALQVVLLGVVPLSSGKLQPRVLVSNHLLEPRDELDDALVRFISGPDTFTASVTLINVGRVPPSPAGLHAAGVVSNRAVTTATFFGVKVEIDVVDDLASGGFLLLERAEEPTDLANTIVFGPVGVVSARVPPEPEAAAGGALWCSGLKTRFITHTIVQTDPPNTMISPT